MDPLLAELGDEELGRIHALMWLFSQGAATLLLSEGEGDPMCLAEGYLALAGESVINFELQRRNL